MLRRGSYFVTRRRDPVLEIFVHEMTNIPLAHELHSLEEKYIPGSQGHRAGS